MRGRPSVGNRSSPAGAIHFGMGDALDAAKLTPMRAGCFIRPGRRGGTSSRDGNVGVGVVPSPIITTQEIRSCRV